MDARLEAAKLLRRIDDAMRISIARKMRTLLRDRRGLRGMADALKESRCRIYPDRQFEQYLDAISDLLVESCQEAANRGDEPEAALLRQATEVINHLRRSRDELRADLEAIGLAYRKYQDARIDAGEAPL